MDRSFLQCKAVCSVGELSWHSTNCYWRPWVDFPIANALEVLIHFDMLIRGHYARNEIKWQREVICLSVNWVFLAGGVCFFSSLRLSLAFAFKWIKWRECGRMLENHFFVSRCCFFYFLFFAFSVSPALFLFFSSICFSEEVCGLCEVAIFSA